MGGSSPRFRLTHLPDRTDSNICSRPDPSVVSRRCRQTADSAALRKARGAFFTPPLIAEFLGRWAIRSADTRVLDPTCGEAVFLLAAAERLKALGATPAAVADQLPESTSTSRRSTFRGRC